jgi:uncharacterized phage infection (PIP) family protein YhgE
MSAIQKVKKYRRGIGAFISSDKGQRFFNFAYSIGAAVVIWGALFKILHLPGGNTLLSLGMGTEVLMFVLTAFDRPPREYQWEKVYPALDNPSSDDDQAEENTADDENAATTYQQAGIGGIKGNVTIVTGSVTGTVSGNTAAAPAAPAATVTPTVAPAAPAGNVADATDNYLEQINAMTDEMRRLHTSTSALNDVSDTLLQSYRAITENSENITRSSTGYVDQMENLNRNIQGLNTIYEIQLKSISSQLDAIDRVNRGIKDIRDMYEKSADQSARYCEETEKMARYMQQLNQVYEKMIHAMTINMYNPMMGGAVAAPQQDNDQQ